MSLITFLFIWSAPPPRSRYDQLMSFGWKVRRRLPPSTRYGGARGGDVLTREPGDDLIEVQRSPAPGAAPSRCMFRETVRG